jgi:hypothetical protein
LKEGSKKENDVNYIQVLKPKNRVFFIGRCKVRDQISATIETEAKVP